MTDFHRRTDDAGVRWAVKNWQLVVFVFSIVGGAFVMNKSINDAHASIHDLQETSSNNQDRLIRLESRVDETQKSLQDIKDNLKEITRIIIGHERGSR